MDASSARYEIGELSRLTGLPVRTIRFYSDSGVVPESGRTAAGYRTYDRDAVDRLGLVRTLRDLGIDLSTIRRVLERELSVTSVAAAHATALSIQIRGLRWRLAVLRAVAQRDTRGAPSGTSFNKEVELMNKLAQLSDAERRRMIEELLDDVFNGLDLDPKFEQMMRSAMPDLPEEPSTVQIEAWVELAELVAQPDFRAKLRGMAEWAATERAEGRGLENTPSVAIDTAQLVATKAGDALAAGIDPESSEAATITTGMAEEYAASLGRADSPEFRHWLIDMVETFTDARAERYWQLLATINGWPPIPSVVPAWQWFSRAVAASLS